MPVISFNALIWVLCVVHMIRMGRPFYWSRVLEGLKGTAAARAEYEAVTNGFAGEEARARYALFLKDQGHADEARQLFEQMLARMRLAQRHYRREQKAWLDLAHAALQALKPSQAQAA